jgi:hypothetical protein
VNVHGGGGGPCGEAPATPDPVAHAAANAIAIIRAVTIMC